MIFREHSHDIVKILANKNRFYVLSSSGQEYFFKCYNLNQALELDQMGRLDNVELHNPSFIEDFKASPILNANILIASDQKFVKIYDKASSLDINAKPTL